MANAAATQTTKTILMNAEKPFMIVPFACRSFNTHSSRAGYSDELVNAQGD
jgi:hypothetical protein